MNNMNTRKEAETHLVSLTRSMKLPQHKKKDPKFIVAKLDVLNKDHPRFEETLALAKLMVSKGWC